MEQQYGRSETRPDTHGTGPVVCYTLYGILYQQRKGRKMLECRNAAVIMALLCKGGEFCIWGWVERRIRANFQPLLQVASVKKQEVLAARRSRMQGARKTEAGLEYVSILPNFSRQIPQDSNKSASARQGPLTLQVCSISQIGIYESRSSIWPTETRSPDRSTQLLWKWIFIPIVWTTHWMWEQNSFSISCKSYSPPSISSKKVPSQRLTLISLLGGRCILLTTESMFQKGEQCGLEVVNYSYRAMQWKCMGLDR